MKVKKIWIYIVICVIVIFSVVSCATAQLPPAGEAAGQKIMVERIGDIEVWEILINNNLTIQTCYLVISPNDIDLECP